ncbi:MULTISPECIES: hypothetical protein [Bradyrhizobium]|uniref:hypothetical protein n=1 Tax=Bradyrhizobium TaxID=374 RepID=UPI0004B313A1|nr:MULTISPECIES: hypothetical protein [Bradyrhizobium]MBR1328718.1 hypothetical protein [Bradyrhizobium ottawaense]MBR1334466.1 hypothetical protein [Bradyrhizobium ottawaense]
MGLSIRFYLFAEDGLLAISQRVMMGLIRGQDAMPQYAGTKQKVADVILENEGKKPLRIETVQGSFLTFDDKGKVHKDLVASGFAALETGMALEEALKQPQTKIWTSRQSSIARSGRENRWTLSKDDLDAIADDIWRRKEASQPRIERAQGIAPKPPKVTYEAKEAIREIRTSLISIDNKLQWLSEPALKGAAFEARENAKIEADGPLWLGIAAAADRYHEIQVRRRTGRGIWYALVEILRWDAVQRTGEVIASVGERCDSKAKAEEAARRLMTENANCFTAETSVHTEVLCELEWDEEAGAKLL